MLAVSDSSAEPTPIGRLSAGAELGAYLRERYPPRDYLLLATGIALLGGAWFPLPALVASAGLAWLLVLQFRLWDDLADRLTDSGRHPERVLCRTARQAIFRGTCGILWLLNALLIAFHGMVSDHETISWALRLGAYLVLSGWYALWYGTLRSFFRSARLRILLTLPKYAAFVYLLAPDAMPAWQLALGMATAYGGMVAYDFATDSRLGLQEQAE